MATLNFMVVQDPAATVVTCTCMFRIIPKAGLRSALCKLLRLRRHTGLMLGQLLTASVTSKFVVLTAMTVG
jgi:hypothetical protein